MIRSITAGVIAVLLAVCGGASAAKPARVAFLGAESPSTSRHFLEAFRVGLRERGYVEGRDIVIEERWAEGRSERFPDLAAEMVRLNVDVIVAVSTPAALAAKSATTVIPIVFIASDPLGSGVVSGLARPGGNMTGVSLALGLEFTGKWLELLREVIPRLSDVAVLWNPDNPANTGYLNALQTAAQQLRVKLKPVGVREPGQIEGAFAAMAAARAQALVVLPDPLTVRYRDTIVARAAKARLPAMYGFREFVNAGGLMAYGSSVSEICRRAATYVDKILKGAKPGDLPVEQPTSFQFVINLKAARALKLAIPPSLLQRADEVIQ